MPMFSLMPGNFKRDDHDFGVNDGGADFAQKDVSQGLFLDFLGVPKDSPRRAQHGVYTSYTFGPIGRQVKILLLDARYHRPPPGSDGDILGEAQWNWLETELHQSQAQLHFIASGTNPLGAAGVYVVCSDISESPRARSRGPSHSD